MVSQEEMKKMRLEFSDRGFSKLAKVIPSDSIEDLRDLLDRSVHPPEQSHRQTELQKNAGGGQFSRYSNSIGLESEVVARILNSSILRDKLYHATGEKNLATNALGFVVEPGQEGLRWHFGFRSFNFIGPTDPGFTLWIPLDKIDVEDQHGGIAVVPESVYSGRDESKLLHRMCLDFERSPDTLPRIEKHLGNFTEFRNIVLDQNSTEYSFELGDALLFSRFVMHKSCPFTSGELNRRRAFVLRFISSRSTYHPELIERQRSLFTRLGLHVHDREVGSLYRDLAPGEEVGQSRFGVVMSS